MKYQKRLPEVVNHFKEKNVSFESYSIDLEAWLVINGFPVASWGRVDWDKFGGKKMCCKFESNQDAAEKARNLLANEIHGEKIILSFSNGLTSDLLVDPEEILDCLWEIFDEGFDVWILDFKGAWCLEKYHEGELCFGRRP